MVSALLMLFALLWLTISLPFVYACQQQVMAQEQAATGKVEKGANLMVGANEEKSESGVNTLSEYLHEMELPAQVVLTIVKYEKCHPADLYFAFHPELLCPPPNFLG